MGSKNNSKEGYVTDIKLRDVILPQEIKETVTYVVLLLSPNRW